MRHRPAVARLKKFPGIWRVDGVGAIHDRGRLGKHCVVYFAGINESYAENPCVKHSINNQRVSLKIHTAQLTRFKVGSLWKDGKLIRFSPEISARCEVNTSNVRVVQLDEVAPIDGELIDSVLPRSYIWFGEDNKNKNRDLLKTSRFAYMPAKIEGRDTWLIVPCSEIARFYYGVSSRLLSSVIAGELEEFISYEDSYIKDDRHRRGLAGCQKLLKIAHKIVGSTLI